MRVAIDVAPAADQLVGGTASVARDLVPALVSARPDWEFLLFGRVPEAQNGLLDLRRSKNVMYRELPGSHLWRLHVTLPRAMRAHGVDLFHSLGYFLPMTWRGPSVVSIHDLNMYRHAGSWMRRRTVLPWLSLAIHTPLAITLANEIITVSDYARSQLLSVMRVDAARVTVVWDAPDPYYDHRASEEDRDAALTLIGGKAYVLAVGVLSPQKNFQMLIRAFARSELPARGYALVVAGKDESGFGSRLAALAGRCGVGSNVKFPGTVERKVLRALYQQALCFVMPSKGEGFGLPLVEAMASGTAVLGSNAQAIPEVLGGAGAIFDASSGEPELTELLNRATEDPRWLAHLRESGYRRRNRFSWQSAADATIKVYERAYSIGP